MLSLLRPLLHVPDPSGDEDDETSFRELLDQGRPATPPRAREQHHSGTEFDATGRPVPPRTEAGLRSAALDAHDRSGSLSRIAPYAGPMHSPRWFAACSMSQGLRARVNFGTPWIDPKVRVQCWGKADFLFCDETVPLTVATAFAPFVVDVPPPVVGFYSTSAPKDPAVSDLAVLMCACGFWLSHEAVYYCECCLSVLKMQGSSFESQLRSVARHFNLAGHIDAQMSIPARKRPASVPSTGLYIFPFLFWDHPILTESVVSADTLMDAVLAERLPRCLKRFASILRSRLNASRHTVFVHQRMGRLFVLEARKEFAPEGFYKGPRERVPPFVLPMGTCPFDVELDAELSFLRFSIDEDIAPSSLGSPSVPATSTSESSLAAFSASVAPSRSRDSLRTAEVTPAVVPDVRVPEQVSSPAESSTRFVVERQTEDRSRRPLSRSGSEEPPLQRPRLFHAPVDEPEYFSPTAEIEARASFLLSPALTTPSSPPPPLEEWTLESAQAGRVPRDVRQGLPPLPENPTEQQIIRRMRAIEERMALLSRVESVSRQLDHLNVRGSSSRPTGPPLSDATPAPGVVRWGKDVRPGWQDPRSLVERMDDPVGPEDWIQWDNGVYAVAGERRDYSIAEVDELNRIANAGPHPEDRYGPDSYDVPLPPQQPKPHFDWDIDSAIARSGLRHPGWTKPSPFVPKSRTWDSICLRGSEREGCGWLRQPPTAVAPEDFVNHEWNEYWQTFGDTECSSRVLRSQVIFEDLKVAGMVSSLDEDCAGRCLLLSGLSAGPYRNVSREESPYPPPYIPAASAILRWLHSADVPAMSVTIHCEHGHRYGEPRSECTVLLCCARHVQLSVHRIMRLSRERPLRPRAYTFVARSNRTFELNLWDQKGRRSGLDKPEALVDLLYKYEVAKNQRDDVPLPFTSFYRWPSFFRDIRPAEWLWAEMYAYPYGADQEYLSLNWIWKQTGLDAGLEEIVYPLMEYYREVDSDTIPGRWPGWSRHGPNA